MRVNLFSYNLIVLFLVLMLCNIAYASSNKGMASQSLVNAISDKIEDFKRKNGRYPSTEDGYMIALGDRSQKSETRGKMKDSWNNEFIYIYPAKFGSKDFDLYSIGANGLDDFGKQDDISNWRELDSSYFPVRSNLYLFMIITVILLFGIFVIFFWKKKSKTC